MNSMDVLHTWLVAQRLGISGKDVARRLGMSEFQFRAHLASSYDEIFGNALKSLGLDTKDPGPLIEIDKNGVVRAI